MTSSIVHVKNIIQYAGLKLAICSRILDLLYDMKCKIMKSMRIKMGTLCEEINCIDDEI